MIRTRTYVCVSGGTECSFFGKFGVLCFLEASFLSFPVCLITDEFINSQQFLTSVQVSTLDDIKKFENGNDIFYHSKKWLKNAIFWRHRFFEFQILGFKTFLKVKLSIKTYNSNSGFVVYHENRLLDIFVLPKKTISTHLR